MSANRDNTIVNQNIPIVNRKNRTTKLLRKIISKYDLYLMLLIPIVWYIVFHYIPIYGVQIAFKNFVPTKGIVGSPWVGFKHFYRFFSSYYFWRLIKNTIGTSLYSLIIGFPTPIMLAILITEIRNNKFKKLLQNITYMPHFLSIVVVVGMLMLFLHPETGIVNKFVVFMGGKPVNFMQAPQYFKTLYVFSGIWQHMGWESIIYIAALSAVSPELYESATIDGASRWKRITNISIPSISSTIIILLILRMGQIMNVGFQKILLMQNSLNKESSDVIQTFVYSMGILQSDYSFSTAVGLFNSLINFGFILLANSISRRYSETSLW
jgi:putative aldouronate transport system permease protein